MASVLVVIAVLGLIWIFCIANRPSDLSDEDIKKIYQETVIKRDR